MRLSAAALESKVYVYEDHCFHCKDIFIYVSKNGLLKQLWDVAKFEVLHKTHIAECVNSRVEKFLNQKGV